MSERMRCVAIQANGNPCMMYALDGAEVCSRHAAVGQAGVYGKHLPRGFRKTYERARTDPDLLAATEETALLRVRISSLLQRLQNHGGGEDFFATLRDLHTSLAANFEAQEFDSCEELISRIGTILKRGERAEKTWSELYEAIDRKTTVAAREWKRQVDTRTMISADRAMSIVQGITQIVLRHVSDTTTRGLIAQEIAALIGGPLPPSQPRVIDVEPESTESVAETAAAPASITSCVPDPGIGPILS